MTKVVTNSKQPRPKPLTPKHVRETTDPGRHGDGHGGFGLSLHVKVGKNGRITKSWNQRLPVEAGRKEIGLGSYPAVSLRSARQKAFENWQTAKAGENVKPIPTPTVSEVFDEVIATRSKGWRTKTTEQAWRRYKRKCKPILDKPVSEVTTGDVLSIITPIWHKLRADSRKIRVALHAVMETVSRVNHSCRFIVD